MSAMEKFEDNFNQAETVGFAKNAFEKSAKVGETYTAIIDHLVGRGGPVEDAEQIESGIANLICEGAKYFKLQSERFSGVGNDPEALLRQLFAEGTIPPEFSDQKRYEFSEPSEGVFVVKIDVDLLQQIRPGASAVAVKIRDGISFVMVPHYDNPVHNEKILKENIPHEVHHLLWKGVLESNMLSREEANQDFSAAFSMYQDELLAKMCSGGGLIGYTHLLLMSPTQREEFDKQHPGKSREILDVAIQINDLLDQMESEMRERGIQGKSLIGAVLHATSFSSLKTLLSECREYILAQPITNPPSPNTGWEYV